MPVATALIHCVYASELSPGYDESELVRILSTARRTNASVGATGVLLFSDRSFFQILEGDPADITPLYRKISRDPRHQQVTKLIEEPITERAFRDWTMGLVRVGAKELSDVAGLADHVAAGRPLSELNPGQARSLHAALVRGPLRMRSESAMVGALISPANRP